MSFQEALEKPSTKKKYRSSLNVITPDKYIFTFIIIILLDSASDMELALPCSKVVKVMMKLCFGVRKRYLNPLLSTSITDQRDTSKRTTETHPLFKVVLTNSCKIGVEMIKLYRIVFF